SHVALPGARLAFSTEVTVPADILANRLIGPRVPIGAPFPVNPEPRVFLWTGGHVLREPKRTPVPARCRTPKRVLLARDELHVVNIDARPVPADVIDHEVAVK